MAYTRFIAALTVKSAFQQNSPRRSASALRFVSYALAFQPQSMTALLRQLLTTPHLVRFPPAAILLTAAMASACFTPISSRLASLLVTLSRVLASTRPLNADDDNALSCSIARPRPCHCLQ